MSRSKMNTPASVVPDRSLVNSLSSLTAVWISCETMRWSPCPRATMPDISSISAARNSMTAATYTEALLVTRRVRWRFMCIRCIWLTGNFRPARLERPFLLTDSPFPCSESDTVSGTLYVQQNRKKTVTGQKLTKNRLTFSWSELIQLHA